MTALNDTALGCTRHYYLRWYEKYVAAAGRLPEPHWVGAPVPGHDTAYDAIVAVKQEEHKARWAAIEAKWAKEEEARQAAEAARQGQEEAPDDIAEEEEAGGVAKEEA